MGGIVVIVVKITATMTTMDRRCNVNRTAAWVTLTQGRQLVIEKEFLEKKCVELGIDLNEKP